ncbi:hypothetical protein G7Z17_g10210 [Cylindrodendrum hubeiense]|uniref:Peptidase C14 caspase domain-containing protein n=1 Tax=Cylindrodendrum hubeiense TaxID=595255 RepID=A0A9P5GZ36_9HYPO|nr:hypothetical protein G7Z17_g10210 [Cylindrodendrum hubeiense]
MATPEPTRFALLVGVDVYHNDGSRTDNDGEIVSLNQLKGCVNDVRAIGLFLQAEFKLHNPSILTSSPVQLIGNNVGETVESADRLPTYANIKREFEDVIGRAKPGNEFFFHFSGHGAKLKTTKKNPGPRQTDPSLLLMDYCCGKPALRGWQLNEWLRKLNERNVRIIVILDSCYSSGSYRHDLNFRTPDWSDIPNLPADEAVTQEVSNEPNTRDGDMDTSWDINPDAFTVMAACDINERSTEQVHNEKWGGVFTQELLGYLKRESPGARTASYNSAREQIAERIAQREVEQKPRFHGKVNLTIFGTKEPILTTQIAVKIDEGKVILPVGKAHGVKPGSEFTNYPPTPGFTFRIDTVDNFESSAQVSEASRELIQKTDAVIQRRWSLGDDVLSVLIDPDFGSGFEEELNRQLEEWIASRVEVTTFQSRPAQANELRLEKREDGGVSIFGPKSLIGYEGPVRGLDIPVNNVQLLAKGSALALAHLIRFGQIHDIEKTQPELFLPFK